MRQWHEHSWIVFIQWMVTWIHSRIHFHKERILKWKEEWEIGKKSIFHKAEWSQVDAMHWNCIHMQPVAFRWNQTNRMLKREISTSKVKWMGPKPVRDFMQRRKTDSMTSFFYLIGIQLQSDVSTKNLLGWSSTEASQFNIETLHRLKPSFDKWLIELSLLVMCIYDFPHAFHCEKRDVRHEHSFSHLEVEEGIGIIADWDLLTHIIHITFTHKFCTSAITYM